MKGDLVSADGTVTSVIVFFDERRVDAVRATVLDRIREIVTTRLPADFRVYYNGSIEISETYNRITLANQTKFTPPILALTLIALYAMFRSWRRTLLTAGAVLVSVIWTLGLYDLLGFNYNVLSSMIVPLVLVLAIADDVHIIQHYGEARRNGTAEEAFKSTVDAPGGADLWRERHDGAGHGLARHEQHRRGAGVRARIGHRRDGRLRDLDRAHADDARLAEAGGRAGAAGNLAAEADAMARVVHDSPCRHGGCRFTRDLCAGDRRPVAPARRHQPHQLLQPVASAQPIRRRDRQSAVGNLHLSDLSRRSAESMRRPDVLTRMERVETELRGLPFVRKVTGLADYVKRVHREIGEATAAAPIPEDAAVIAQELFVFSLADAGRVELERIAASDFSKAQITVKLASMSSDIVFAQIDTAQRLVDQAFGGTDIKATVTGSGRLFATLDHYLVISQISSFATAFFTVFGVIFIVFRSWRFGLLAIIPNLFPVLAIFGVMGWLGISLNVATVMLASVALGVVDDDTIHFISRYRRETAAGRSTDEAISLATEHEGRASLTTAVINSLAFGVLALSEYKPTAWFGSLLAVTMVVAFLAEVFVLPATIKLLPSLFGADRVHAARRRAGAAA